MEGKVSCPGTFPVEPGRTMLSHVLAWARPDSARPDLAHIRILREARHDPETRYMAEDHALRLAQPLRHDYLKSRLIHEGGRVSLTYDSRYFDPAKVPVLAGDRIQVLRGTTDVEVLGAVHAPGFQKLRENWTVGDYVEAAGGKLDCAARNCACAARARTSSLPPGRARAWRPATSSCSCTGTRSTPWEKFKEGLAVVSQIVTVALVVRSI